MLSAVPQSIATSGVVSEIVSVKKSIESRCAHAYCHAISGRGALSEIVSWGRTYQNVRMRVVTLWGFFVRMFV